MDDGARNTEHRPRRRAVSCGSALAGRGWFRRHAAVVLGTTLALCLVSTGAGRAQTVPPTPSAAAFLRGRGIQAIEAPDIHTAIDDLLSDRADAFVYDRAVLLATLARHPKPISVLPGAYSIDYYAFALPANSPLRRPLNAAMLEAINSPAWQQTLTQYFGSSAEQL